MVQRAVEGAYKQSVHRAVTCSQTNRNREEASKQGASSRFVSGRLPRAGNLPKGFRPSAGDWTAPSPALPSGAKLPNQAHAKETAGRTPAKGSAVQRPTQRIAMANAARCEKRSNEMRQVTQPILPISHTGKEARRQAKGLMLVGSISPECIGIRSCKQRPHLLHKTRCSDQHA